MFLLHQLVHRIRFEREKHRPHLAICICRIIISRWDMARQRHAEQRQVIPRLKIGHVYREVGGFSLNLPFLLLYALFTCCSVSVEFNILFAAGSVQCFLLFSDVFSVVCRLSKIVATKQFYFPAANFLVFFFLTSHLYVIYFFIFFSHSLSVNCFIGTFFSVF